MAKLALTGTGPQCVLDIRLVYLRLNHPKDSLQVAKIMLGHSPYLGHSGTAVDLQLSRSTTGDPSATLGWNLGRYRPRLLLSRMIAVATIEKWTIRADPRPKVRAPVTQRFATVIAERLRPTARFAPAQSAIQIRLITDCQAPVWTFQPDFSSHDHEDRE